MSKKIRFEVWAKNVNGHRIALTTSPKKAIKEIEKYSQQLIIGKRWRFDVRNYYELKNYATNATADQAIKALEKFIPESEGLAGKKYKSKAVIKGASKPSNKTIVRIDGHITVEELEAVAVKNGWHEDADKNPDSEATIKKELRGHARYYSSRWLEVWKPVIRSV